MGGHEVEEECRNARRIGRGVREPGHRDRVCGAGTSGPVRIGLEGPLSGDQKSIGIGMLDGARLAAAEINGRGGLAGRRLEIVPIDDAADPATGEKAASAAIEKGLDGVIGPYNSGVGAKTLPLYLAADIVPIRLTSADATAGLGFTLQPMTSQIAPVAPTRSPSGTAEVGGDHLQLDRSSTRSRCRAR